MPLQCPNCGSRFLRDSKPQNAAEKLGRFRFISPLRCLDCKTRFIAKTIDLSDFLYARCPKCGRMDLSDWKAANFAPRAWIDFLVTLGAKRLRCEYCRLNFASFRKLKESFSFQRWKKMKVGKTVAEGRAKFAEEEQRAMARHEAELEEAKKLTRKAEEEAAAKEAEEEAELQAQERVQAQRKAQAKAEKQSRRTKTTERTTASVDVGDSRPEAPPMTLPSEPAVVAAARPTGTPVEPPAKSLVAKALPGLPAAVEAAAKPEETPAESPTRAGRTVLVAKLAAEVPVPMVEIDPPVQAVSRPGTRLTQPIPNLPASPAVPRPPEPPGVVPRLNKATDQPEAEPAVEPERVLWRL